jgi:hypothetical protein
MKRVKKVAPVRLGSGFQASLGYPRWGYVWEVLKEDGEWITVTTDLDGDYWGGECYFNFLQSAESAAEHYREKWTSAKTRVIYIQRSTSL